MNYRTLSCVGLLATCAAACGAPSETAAEDPASGELQPAGSVEQAIGEAACTNNGNVDANIQLSTHISTKTVISPNANYGHSGCPHAYNVNTGLFVAGGGEVHALYGGPVADGVTFPCNGMWMRMVYWEFNGTDSSGKNSPFPNQPVGYVRVVDRTISGSNNPAGGCLQPTTSVQQTTGGGSITSVTAGYTTLYEPVVVTTVTH